MSDKIILDLTINDYLAKDLQRVVTISSDDWKLILEAIEATENVLRITPANPAAGDSLHEIIEGTIKDNTQIKGHDSVLACIVAVLENEGAIDLTYKPNSPINLVKTDLPE